MSHLQSRERREDAKLAGPMHLHNALHIYNICTLKGKKCWYNYDCITHVRKKPMEFQGHTPLSDAKTRTSYFIRSVTRDSDLTQLLTRLRRFTIIACICLSTPLPREARNKATLSFWPCNTFLHSYGFSLAM